MSATVAVVVGNPRPGSRTLSAARSCGERLAAGTDAILRCFDLIELGPALLSWGEPRVQEVVEAMRSSTVSVIASPTYKATYTGVLKLLFDQVPAGSMGGVLGVPMMVAGAPDHALALDVHLRPLLVEVGFSCPGPGLFVLESELGSLDTQLDSWIGRWEPWLARPVPGGNAP